MALSATSYNNVFSNAAVDDASIASVVGTAGDYMLVAINTREGAGALGHAAPTWNGETLTQLYKQVWPTGSEAIGSYVWGKKLASSTTATVTSVQQDASPAIKTMGVVVITGGVHATTPVGTPLTQQKDATSWAAPSLTLTDGTTGDLAVEFILATRFDYVAAGDSGASWAPASSQTELFEVTNTGSSFFPMLVSATKAGASSVALGYTPSAGNPAYAHFAITVKASASLASISSPTPSGTLGTSTTATIGCTTNQNTGTFYCVVDSAANLSGVTAPQIKAGQKASGAAALAANTSSITTTTPSAGVTGLTGGTLYSYRIVQNNANGDSNILSGTFTTAAATYTGSIVLVNNSGAAYATTAFQWFSMSTYGVTITGTGTATTNGSGLFAVSGVTVAGSGWLTGKDVSTGLIVFGPTPVTFA